MSESAPQTGVNHTASSDVALQQLCERVQGPLPGLGNGNCNREMLVAGLTRVSASLVCLHGDTLRCGSSGICTGLFSGRSNWSWWPSHEPGEVGWGGWGYFQWKWVCQSGSVLGNVVRQLQGGQGPGPAVEGRWPGVESSSRVQWKELILTDVSAKKRSLSCRRALHKDTSHSQRCPERAAPQGVCSTPSSAVWLGQVEPKLPEQWGRVRRAPGLPKTPRPKLQCHRTLSSTTSPQPFPQCLLVLLGLGMNQQEKGVLFLPLWTSPLFCHTETGTKELKSWWIEILTSAEGWAICFWMEGRGWIFGDNCLLYWFIMKQNSIFT